MTTLLLALLAACGGNLQTQEAPNGDFEEPSDEDAPVITFAPITDAQPDGVAVEITATIDDGEDGTGVLFVYLRYKNETGSADDYRDALMTSDGGTTWTGMIPGDAADGSAGVFYYIEAVDGNDNTSYSPTRGIDDPYHYRVYAQD